jgi:hypothetical protein
VAEADPEVAFGVAVEPSELELFELELLDVELFELELLVPEFDPDLVVPEDDLAEDEPAVGPDDVLLVLVCVEPGS